MTVYEYGDPADVDVLIINRFKKGENAIVNKNKYNW